jgi:hypothetical protein
VGSPWHRRLGGEAALRPPLRVVAKLAALIVVYLAHVCSVGPLVGVAMIATLLVRRRTVPRPGVARRGNDNVERSGLPGGAGRRVVALVERLAVPWRAGEERGRA